MEDGYALAANDILGFSRTGCYHSPDFNGGDNPPSAHVHHECRVSDNRPLFSCHRAAPIGLKHFLINDVITYNENESTSLSVLHRLSRASNTDRQGRASNEPTSNGHKHN
jgi:hypothetical protein